MTVTLYNLTDKEKRIVQTIWDLKTREQYLELLKSLPESQRFEVNSMIKMINWGTDDVVDLHEANEIIDRFRL
jgi:hypothetical protein